MSEQYPRREEHKITRSEAMSLECLQEYVLTEIMQTALQNNIVVWST